MQSRNKSTLSLFEVAQKVSNGKARLVTTKQKISERNDMFKDNAISTEEFINNRYPRSGVISLSNNPTPGWQIDQGR
jgi:hypothetical protein